MATQSNRPEFSVLMATHLRAPLLRRSLSSLRAQTFQDFEIIVVADAWDAETAAVAAELLRPQDRFIKRSGKPGPAESRNTALDHAQGEWIVFLDDDDSFEPQHLAQLAAAHRAGPARVLYSDCDIVTEDRTQTGMPPLSRQRLELGSQNTQQLWVKNYIPNHALAFHHTVLDGVRFDTHMASLEDWEFLLAACEHSHLPSYYPGGGAVVHKDYVNPGTRRGTAESSTNSLVILDFLYAYRRRPAPTAALREARRALLTGVGLSLPVEWF
jgi:glycosyltransferase involved in cell wall biosynthesis